MKEMAQIAHLFFIMKNNINEFACFLSSLENYFE